MAGDTYQIGNELFVMLRAFLDSAGVDPSECKVLIELPNPGARNDLVHNLQKWAPPIPTLGRGMSSAQAGNFGGKWQGVSYEFTLHEPKTQGKKERN